MSHPPEIVNFGANIRFRPKQYYEPRTEDEVLDILRRHARDKIRVVAALHSWSDLLQSDDAVVCLKRFTHIETRVDDEGHTHATVGAGCRIKFLLKELGKQNLTLPAIGLITEQMIAGAIATGTHGSGNHSISHHVEEVRLAAYNHETGEPEIFTISEGDDLRAARCHLGCMGVILSVSFRCVPQYYVGEINAKYETIEEVLAHEEESPLQHFFLQPHRWGFTVQHRSLAQPLTDPMYRLDMRLYFIGFFITFDVGLHLAFKLLVSVLRSRSLTRLFHRHVVPFLLLEDKTYIGRSDQILTWEHELFRHFEIELFVPKEHLPEAAEFITEVLKVCDGATREPSEKVAALLDRIDMRDRLASLHGVFTHHYPICIRRILRDDTLISMATGDDECWYSFSFITLSRPRENFKQMADFLAESTTRLFRARLHWGKYFPLGHDHARTAYPRLDDFTTICRKYDPLGVFQNAFTEEILGLNTAEGHPGS